MKHLKSGECPKNLKRSLKGRFFNLRNIPKFCFGSFQFVAKSRTRKVEHFVAK